jgi:predicted nucleotide-binding protein
MTSTPLSRRVFVVHGHDDGAQEAVARFLEKIGFEPVILHEQASRTYLGSSKTVCSITQRLSDSLLLGLRKCLVHCGNSFQG